MIVGIDLGTTNSAAAIWRDGAPVLIPNRLGNFLTPSAVSIDNGVLTVGMPARDRQLTHPADTATAFKRYMGTKRQIRLGQRLFTPEELSALVLRSLKEDAEAFTGGPVTEAIITVPAYFNDRQRKATRQAGELAGLSVERLINEPTAASLAYGLHQLDDEARFLVFDLGGGTFDVSIVEIFEGIIEVRASTGDNSLGGEDFNEVLIALGCAKTGQAVPHSGALYQRLRDAAERSKRALTGADTAPFAYVWADQAFDAEISAEEFETAAAPLLARLREPVVQALRDSNIRPDTLSEIVLIGGSTRMPLVRRMVTRMFGRFPNANVNPDLAVAMGAAIQAGLKERDAALKEVVLTDVCPYSLGVDTTNRLPNGTMEYGVFSPIIERNTVIPASRVRTYGTLVDNQKLVRFNIYQGEDRHTDNNVQIGAIEVPVPLARAGQAVECRFSYDINGLLEVDVHIPSSGERRQLVIADESEPPEALAARRARLAELKVHPRDTEAVRALMARADRCWQVSLGEKREWIDRERMAFAAALDTQNPRIVEPACARFTKALDQIEGTPYL